MEFFINDSNKRKFILALLAVVIGIFIFIAFRILYTAGISEYAKEFTAGCIGAVITIFATAVLLKSQTESEVTKDQLSGMFKEKLDLYRAFIGFLTDINTDGELRHDELKKLVEWGGNLSLVCRPGVIRIIYEYIFQLIAFGSDNYDDLSEDKKDAWKSWMLDHYDGMESEFQDEEFCKIHYAGLAKIIIFLRDDLSNKKISDFDENLNIELFLEQLLSLHSAHEIDFNSDGTHNITQVYQQPRSQSQKSRKSPKNTPKAG